jgi:hypothetical protein
MERKEDKTKRLKREKEKELLIEQLKRVPIIQLAADKVGIARSSHFRWCKEDAAYARKVEDAIIEGVSVINDGAEAQLINAIRDRDMRAIALWLRSNHPRYANKLEVSGTINTRKLTPEEEEIKRKAMRMMGVDISKDK